MKNQELSVKGLALTCGIIWSVSVLFITFYPTVTEMMGTMHGGSVRFVMEDLYPFYSHATWYGVLAGVAVGFIDGFVGGAIFAWLYNRFTK